MLTLRRSLAIAVIALANLALLSVVGTAGMLLLLNGDAIEWSDVRELVRDAYWWGCVGVPAIVVVATQTMFILPLLGARPVMAPQGKPLMRTVAVAALIAGALTAGLFFAVSELCGAFAPVVDRLFDSGLRNQLPPLMQGWFGALWPWLFIVAGWVIWTPVLLTFARRDPASSRWSRWVFALLGGTALETLVVVPIDIMVRRRSDCYCGSGSFFALLISMWALLWVSGPGIVIAATSRRRRLWGQTHCRACAHAKGPSPGPRCPECGFAWTGLDKSSAEARRA